MSRDDPSSSWRAVTWKVDPANGNVSWWETLKKSCIYEDGRAGETAWKCWQVVTTRLVRDEPSLEKSTRLMELSVVPSTLLETNWRAMPFESVNLVSMKKYKVKHAISNELSRILFSCKHNCVFRGDREPSRVPEPTLNFLRNKTSILKEFVYVRIRPSIPKSSRLRCWVNWLEKFQKRFVRLIQVG